uniref:Uncharacterized protein n=1 Tax=Anopheles coluzzii TaxID=1518534 RepID=A0A8W7P9J6_ANOCL
MKARAKQSHMHENPSDFNTEASFPRFAEPIPNITVTIGRDALLACVVDNLKGYKLSTCINADKHAKASPYT